MKHFVRVYWGVFCLAVILSFPMNGQLLGRNESVKRAVAILPIQKSITAPLVLSREPGLVGHINQMLDEKKFSMQAKPEYDPTFIKKTLGELITQKVLDKGFVVFAPEQMAPLFERAEVFRDEISFERLKDSFNADAFLVITITEWEAESFDRDGKVRVGFRAELIDSAREKAVWTNKASRMKLEAPEGDFLFAKYQRDVLQDLAGRILKGFPKEQWNEPAVEKEVPSRERID